MRIKLTTLPPIPQIRIWYDAGCASRSYTVNDLLHVLLEDIKLLEECAVDDLVLEIDGFDLLPNSTVESVIRDGELVVIKYVPNAAEPNGRPGNASRYSATPQRLLKGVTHDKGLLSVSESGSNGRKRSLSVEAQEPTPKLKRHQVSCDTVQLVGEAKETGVSVPAADESNIQETTAASKPHINKAESEVPHHDSSSSDVSSSDSGSDSESESESEADDWGDKKIGNSSDSSSSDSDFGSDSNSSSSSSSESSSEDEDDDKTSKKDVENKPQPVVLAKPTTTQQGPTKPPGGGSLKTKLRNARKRRRQKLTELIAEGKLPPGASFDVMDQYLGVKTPPTKEQIRQQNTAVQGKGNVMTDGSGELSLGKAEPGWEKRVKIRAIECELEGAPYDIDVPPFPFPMDPPRKKRNQASNAETAEEKNGKAEQPGKKVEPGTEAPLQLRNFMKEGDEPLKGSSLQEQIEELLERRKRELEGAIAKPLPTPSGPAPTPSKQEADLPDLPADMSTLQPLDTPPPIGSTIAYKHLTMNMYFEPVLSEYITARVLEIIMDGRNQLTLELAKRDRPEKRYDEETGERIYGKFEMPGVEEDEEGEEGIVTLEWADLVEPRLVQKA
ncbi:hypothetical protein YB2330_001668 [Saitoella coloradoensis]